MSTAPLGSPAPATRGPRVLAGISCLLQALALLGFAAYYLYELSLGEGSDATRVVMSALVILVGAVGLGVLAKGWFGERGWPRTPTLVWHLLLVPVAVSLFQAGRSLLASVVLLVALVTVVAAVAVRRDPEGDGAPDPDEDHAPGDRG